MKLFLDRLSFALNIARGDLTKPLKIAFCLFAGAALLVGAFAPYWVSLGLVGAVLWRMNRHLKGYFTR